MHRAGTGGHSRHPPRRPERRAPPRASERLGRNSGLRSVSVVHFRFGFVSSRINALRLPTPPCLQSAFGWFAELRRSVSLLKPRAKLLLAVVETLLEHVMVSNHADLRPREALAVL
mmetsp:Transcript_13932/g.37389  ORF Transcript_13932/g.37389 Transcript_13932/m.37389 type:complete len:116 (+) Transcript_13932:327-674(+)